MEYIDKSELIIIKIGASLIDHKDGLSIREDWLYSLIDEIADLKKQGKQIVIVSSGSVVLGKEDLGFNASSKLKLEEKQAASACGQAKLINIFSMYFRKYNINLAQVLINIEDSEKKKRITNTRSTLDILLKKGIIPIISENNTLATAELRYGDHDRLSAIIAQILQANLLILLSDVDGLYGFSKEIIKEVYEIDKDIEKMASTSSYSINASNMAIKVTAAKIATNAGCNVILTNGYLSSPIKRMKLSGKYTIFYASVNNRKNWILEQETKGFVQLNINNVRTKQSQSIYSKDIESISGEFKAGDIVLIRDLHNKDIGKGIVANSSENLYKVVAKTVDSSQYELIHFNDIAIF